MFSFLYILEFEGAGEDPLRVDETAGYEAVVSGVQISVDECLPRPVAFIVTELAAEEAT
jgi:hypothetical protein